MTNPKEALEWYERKQVEARAMADRNCEQCKHNKPDGCSRWECEYEPRADDTISRQDAIDAIERNAYRHTYHSQIIDIVESLPSADAVEVVRCKDCKWSD